MPSTEQQASDWTSTRRVSVPDVRGLSADSHDRPPARPSKLNVRPPAPWVDGFDDLPNSERGMKASRPDRTHLTLPFERSARFVEGGAGYSVVAGQRRGPSVAQEPMRIVYDVTYDHRKRDWRVAGRRQPARRRSGEHEGRGDPRGRRQGEGQARRPGPDPRQGRDDPVRADVPAIERSASNARLGDC